MLILLFIVLLSVIANYPVYRILAADPNLVSRRQLNAWNVPAAPPMVRLDILNDPWS